MHALIRDRLFLLMLSLTALPLAVYALPHAQGSGFASLWAGHLAEPILLTLTIVTLIVSRRPTEHHEERIFWRLVLATCTLWFIGSVAEYFAFAARERALLNIVRHGSFLLSYVTLILSADLRPHLPGGWTRSGPGFSFSVTATFLCVIGIILYFFVLPTVEAGPLQRDHAALVTFEALDILLVIRFVHLSFRAAGTRLAVVFTLLVISTAAAAVSDGLNLLIAEGRFHLGFGTAFDALWWLPMLAMVAARRLRALQTDSGAPDTAALEEPRTDSIELLSLYAIAFPTTHLLIHTFSRPAGNEPASNLLVLAALVAFVALGVAQQRLLEKRNRELRSELQVLVTNEQVVQSQKLEAVGRLAGGLAHDFNNLLTVVVGRADILASSLPAGEDQYSAREILNTAQRGAAITRQLLAFSRRQVMRTRSMDLSAEVREGESILQRLVGERHQIALDLAAELKPVEAEPSQVFQVLLNLVANARDAMPDGGAVSIRTYEITLGVDEPDVVPPSNGGTFAAIEVSDTGGGIDGETQLRMYDPFFTRKVGGTGLGLAVVYGIVTQSGGHLRVQSVKGQGTTFTAMLPYSTRPNGQDAQGAPARGPAPAPALTVLLVEDQEPVRRLVRMMLTTLGYHVLEAASGEQALALCRQAPAGPDLLLSDVVMPGMRGPEVAARLRELRPGVGIVLMSGFAERGAEEAMPGDPGVGFIAKPFTLEILRDALAEAAAGLRTTP